MRATAVPPGWRLNRETKRFMSAKVARRVIGKPRRPQPPPRWGGTAVARRLRLDSEPNAHLPRILRVLAEQKPDGVADTKNNRCKKHL